MERIVYLNGEFIPESEAKLSIFDRGLLFADAVYEGFGIIDGQLADFKGHMDRLDRSLGDLIIRARMVRAEMLDVLMRLIKENDQREGSCICMSPAGRVIAIIFIMTAISRMCLPSHKARNLPLMPRQNWSAWPVFLTSAGRAVTSKQRICLVR